MIDALTTLDPGLVHPTGASTAPLPIEQYSALMSDTVFAPCPQGWENLDSFRVYEALEAGCIPIVERRPRYDYFRLLLGEHPMVTIDHWKEAPEAIRVLQRDPLALETRRTACATWWQATRRALVDRVRDHCVEGFGLVEGFDRNGMTAAP